MSESSSFSQNPTDQLVSSITTAILALEQSTGLICYLTEVYHVMNLDDLGAREDY